MLLSTHARTLLEDSGNTLMLSTASVWEIDVKHALGRLRLPDNLPPADFIPEARPRNGVDTLPITGTDALQLPKLPRIHQDPFDRMLICQAIANQAVILTLEPLIARCPVSVQW
jgi:PIN domain nuclease of toxin-antitoxin system